MPLYSSGSAVANVLLTDTFNTWRVATNKALTDATSISANVNVNGSWTFETNPGESIRATSNVVSEQSVFANTVVATSRINTDSLRVDGSALLRGHVTAPKVTANSFVGPINGDLTGTLQTASQGNITTVGTLNGGAISSGFGNINVGSSSITGGTITGTTLAGTLSTAAQGNITSVGALNGGSITSGFGNINVGSSSLTGGTITGTALDLNGSGDVSGSMVIHGDLTVNGNTITISTTTLEVDDNMIYLNANSIVTNPDLGWAGNYNDGGYAHAGFFRDATDGRFKAYDGYTLEPDASAEINTGHASFNLADIQAGNFIGNLTGTVSTAAQGSITSLGTLTSLTMGGTLDTNGNNLTMGGGQINGEGGTYTNLHPSVGSSSTTINANVPVNTRTMAGADTFTISNSAAGKSTLLLLDTSTSDHDPTWPSSFKWSAATEPTWDDYRYWVVSIYCLDGSFQLVSATGHDTA